MLTSQLKDALVQLFAVLTTDAKPLTLLVDEFSNTYHGIENQLPSFASDSDKWQTSSGSIHNLYASAAKILPTHSFRTVFAASHSLQNALRLLSVICENKLANDLADEVQAFEQLLDEYIASHSMSHAPLILKGAAQMAIRLKSFEAWTQSILQALTPLQPEIGEEALKLTLYIDPSLDELVVKLGALRDLLELLTSVLASVGHDVTYRLIKLETGSCYIELIAQKVGIIAFKNLLTSVTSYLYRTKTTEGQLKYGVPLEAAAIREAIKVQQALKKAGIDVPGMDDALAEQGELFVRKVSTLVGGADSMKVGDIDLHPIDMLPRPSQQTHQLRLPPSP